MTKKIRINIQFVRIILYILFIINLELLIVDCSAQSGGVAINSNGEAADNSAMLDVSGTSQGVLINRMSTLQRDSIAIKCSCIPAEGLQIYNTTTKCFEAYYGNVWQPLTCLCSSAPTAAGSISGASTVCPGQNAVLYSVPAIARATSYIWSYSGAGAVIVGSTNTVIVYFSLAATSGDLTVMGTNACGNGTFSADYPIAVNSTAPNITVQPISATTCLGGGAVSLNVTATGGLTYQWQEFVSSWNNIANAGVYSNVTTATLTITNPPSGMDGNKYRCVVSGTCTSTTSDGMATLTVNPIPTLAMSDATQTICSGIAITQITLSNPNSVPGTTTYSWTRDNTSNITGIAASGTGNISGTLTNTTATQQITTFTGTATSQYGCISTTATAAVT
ncbi:MAG: hypothetical protein HGB12_06095, partial [Bacteroidetes bacterium]|nr:hypothetical protein [Bacteroidota bacterium]